MKNKKLLGILGITALLLAGNFAWREAKEVDAANTDNSKEKWSAIGTINGSNWDKDFALAYDETDDRYELEIALTVNQEFKIRLNNAWTTSIGYGGNTGAGISTYLSNSGGNFKVKTTGNYVLWVKDDNVKNYGDKSYGFGIDKAAAVEYCTVTHYTKEGTQLKTEQVIKNSTYNPAFEEIEGYALEGWYTNKDLTQKIEKGAKVTGNLNLYPKYVEASDFTVYFIDPEDAFAGATHAYMWCEAFDGHANVAWPGLPLNKDSDGRYTISVDASKSYDKIIFNGGNNKPQTVNLELTGVQNGDTFILGTTKDSEEHYNAEVNATSVTSLFNTYYNEGSYKKVSDIYVNKEVEHDVSQYFHTGNIAELHRTTVYSDGRLLMTTEKDKNGVGYKTVGEDMVRFHVVDGQDVNDYTVKGTSVEDYYVTLADFLLSSSTSHYGTLDMLSGWTYSNGIYSNSSEDVLDAFRLFTAPMWVGKTAETENYIIFSKATVEVVNGDLVMKLWATGEKGKLTNDKDLFSQAVISLN